MITTNEIKTARAGMPYGSIKSEVRKTGLDGIVKRLYALKGYAITQEVEPEIQGAVNELEARISLRWPSLTLGEIDLALEAGICGDFPGDKRLNIANYISWITAYMNSTERRDAIQEMNKRKPQTDPRSLLPATDAERMAETACKEGIRKSWSHYKMTGNLGISLNGWAAAQFDCLVRAGKLNASQATIKAAVESHKDETYGRTIEQIMQEVGSNGVTQAIGWAAKKDLLALYYESLVKRGVELTI